MRTQWVKLSAEGPGFSLLAVAVLGAALLTMFLRDPARVSALQGRLDRLQQERDFETNRSIAEIRSLQLTVTQNQQALTENQRELLNTQEALRRAYEAVSAYVAEENGLRGRMSVSERAPVVAKAKQLPQAGTATISPSNADQDQFIQLVKQAAAVKNAIIQNATEYVLLVRALAETRKALALAQGADFPVASLPGGEGTPLALRPAEDFLTPECRAVLGLMEAEVADKAMPAPGDLRAAIAEIDRLSPKLLSAQRHLLEGQNELISIQKQLARLREAK